MASELDPAAPGDSILPQHLARISMVLGDIQGIVTQTSQKITGKERSPTTLGSIAILVLSVILLLAIISMSLRNCGSQLSEEHKAIIASGGTCLTPPCLETAAYMLESLDPTADPCEDFFQYACGSWVKNTGIPPQWERTDVAKELVRANEDKMRHLLEAPLTKTRYDSHSSKKKLKDFYKMCMHDYGRSKDSSAKIIDMIKTDLGGWYAFNPDNWTNTWHFNDALETIHAEFIVKALFKYYVWPDYRNWNNMIIVIYPSFLGLYSSYYERPDKESVRQTYKDYIRRMGGLLLRDANISLSDNETKSRLDQFVNDVFEQERQLAKMKTSGRYSYWWRLTYKKLSDLHKELNQINWQDIFMKLFSTAHVTGSTVVEVMQYDYFTALDELLKKESTDRDRMMNNYLVWTLIKEMSKFLSWEYRHARYKFYDEAYGITEFPSTWSECMRIIKIKMPLLLAALFVDTHVNKTANQHIQEISEAVRKQAKLSLKENIDWMEEKTKANAQLKLDQMVFDVGFPPALLDTTDLDWTFATLRVDTTKTFFENIISINAYILKSQNDLLNMKSKDRMWRWAARRKGFGASPYYWHYYNLAMVAPGAVVQPMYERGAPASINYGSMGSRFGGFMVYAIGEWGRYTINGTWRKWWTDTDYNQYKKKKDCYLSYYQNQTAGPYDINGQQKSLNLTNARLPYTLIPRTDGLNHAYKAFKEYMRNNTNELPLPGLNMTHDQIFFLTAAQTRCYTEHPKDEYRDARWGTPPDNIRINGWFAFSSAFSEAFKCPKKAKMNTGIRCRTF